jgi:predicted secreted protein
MGTPIQGVGGGVKNGANLVLNVNTWSISEKASTVETIAFGSTGGWQTRISTFKDWTASCDGKTDPADTTGQVALINGLGNTFTLDFAVGSSPTQGHWSGTGILVAIDPKSDAAGMNEISFNFEGTGPMTFALT